jgi:hypothetical protein
MLMQLAACNLWHVVQQQCALNNTFAVTFDQLGRNALLR